MTSFGPDPRLRTKYLIELFIIPLIPFLIVVTPLILTLGFGPGILGMTTFIFPVLFWVSLLCFGWTIPVAILILFYYQSIHYEIGDEELVVRRGLLTKSVKMVPIRAVTNISLRRGLFDRLLGIGSIKVETAGQMGSDSSAPSPELSLDGLREYEKIYRQISSIIKHYQPGYTPITKEEAPPSGEVTELLRQILDELRRMRTALTHSPT